MTTIEKLQNNIDVSADEYCYAAKDYLVANGYVSAERFTSLINDDSEWGITRHYHFTKIGIDYLVRYLTDCKYLTFKELISND